MTKQTVTAGPVVSGDLVEFTITVTNQGPHAVQNIGLVDYVPNRLDLVETNSWTSNGTDQAVTTLAGPLAPGASTNLSIFMVVQDQFSGTALNYAEISGAETTNGFPVVDVDSTLDDINLNTETNVVDDVTDNSGGDEDDHDVASILVEEPPTTYALIESFAGTMEGGEAVLRWETSSESGTDGFVVWRQAVEDEQVAAWHPVSELKPAIGVSAVGARYQHVDAGAQLGVRYRYKVVERTVRGREIEHGPYEVTFAPSSRARTASVATRAVTSTDGFPWEERVELGDPASEAGPRSVEKQETRRAASSTRSHATRASGSSSTLPLKVEVTEAGLLQIDRTSLPAAASYQVRYLGEVIAADLDSENLRFVVEERHTRYTDRNVYWIEAGESPAWPVRTVGAGTFGPEGYWVDSLTLEENENVRPDLYDDADSDPWLWHRLLAGFVPSATTTFDLPGVKVDEVGSLQVRLKGAADRDGVAHVATVTLNGTVLGTVPVDGIASVRAALTVPASTLQESGNQLVVSIGLEGGFFQTMYVDGFDLAYARTYQAENDALRFDVASGGEVTVRGFSQPDITVLDVTDPATAVELVGPSVTLEGSTYAVSFQAPQAGRYMCVASGGEVAGTLVPAHDDDLMVFSNQADWLLIAPADWHSEAQALAAHRSSQGLMSRIVDLEAIEDEFNYGIRDPRAIRRFLRYAYRMWERAPRYVVLAGTGSLDYRNDSGFDDCVMPSLTAGTPQGQVVSDYGYADVTGNGQAELAIGRLPVSSAAELAGLLTKIAGYDVSGGWKQEHVMLADDPDEAGSFQSDGDAWAALLTSETVDKLYFNASTVSLKRNELLRAIDQGLGTVAYYGHANLRQLADENVFAAADASALSNQQAGVWLNLTCYSGDFGLPGSRSLGVELLLNETGGASVVLAAGGEVQQHRNRRLGDRLASGMDGGTHARWGDLVIDMTQGPEAGAKHYSLLGDPASARGDADSARAGALRPTDQASYDEWLSWRVAPSRLDAGYGADPARDDDGDGVSNQDEYVANTDPTLAGSYLYVRDLEEVSTGVMRLRWPSEPNVTYRLEWAASLYDGFTLVQGGIASTPNENVMEVDVEGDGPVFFRVKVE